MTTPAESEVPAAAPSPQQLELVLGAHVERLKNRDLESFDEIYRLTRDEVARILFHLSAPGADLERMVGDVYVRLFEDLRRLPSGAPVRPLVHRACTKVALHRPGLFARAARPAPAADESPAAQAAARLHAALSRLPARQRLAFVFSEVLGLSTDETLAATGLSRDSLSSHMRRARLELTRALRNAEAAAEVTP